MAVIPASEDRWDNNHLIVRLSNASSRPVSVISGAIESALSSVQRQGDTILGLFQGSPQVAVSLLRRPTRRQDKSFLFKALAARQEMQERFPERQAVLYLVIDSSVLDDIQLYAGAESFYQAIQAVGLGVFSYGASGIVFNPLKPDSQSFGGTGEGVPPPSNYYSEPKLISNKLGEASLATLGTVQYA